jgi:hypothetical protein
MLPLLFIMTNVTLSVISNTSGDITTTISKQVETTNTSMKQITSIPISEKSTNATVLKRPLHTDIVVITIKDNWTNTCHHVNLYLSEFCSIIMRDPAEDCKANPLQVGDMTCHRGICICLRRSSAFLNDDTIIRAEVTHRLLIGNNTLWPDWISSVSLYHEKDEDVSWTLAVMASTAITVLFVVACAVRVYGRYVGYKKVIPPDEVVTENTRLTNG